MVTKNRLRYDIPSNIAVILKYRIAFACVIYQLILSRPNIIQDERLTAVDHAKFLSLFFAFGISIVMNAKAIVVLRIRKSLS